MPMLDIFSANRFKEEFCNKNLKSNVVDVKLFKEFESILVFSGDFRPEWKTLINYFENEKSKPDISF